MLILSRYITIIIPNTTRTLVSTERRLLYFFAPKGLAAGLLAISLANYSNILPGTDIISNIVFSVIIIFILITTIALFVYKQYTKKTDQEQEPIQTL